MKKIFPVGLVLAAIAAVVIGCGGEIGIPILTNPTGGEEVALPVLLVWQPVVDASGYRVEVDTFIDFSTALVNEVGDTTYSVDFLQSRMYYWHVAAYDNNDNLGEFCDIDSFFVHSDSIQ